MYGVRGPIVIYIEDESLFWDDIVRCGGLQARAQSLCYLCRE
jgi:hypothetical protein